MQGGLIHLPACSVELGTIMLWYYIADRTTVFPRNSKSYSRDVLGFIFLALTLVAGWTSLKPCRTPMLLNRQQTEEWKGWMQASFACVPAASCQCLSSASSFDSSMMAYLVLSHLLGSRGWLQAPPAVWLHALRPWERRFCTAE